jgi:hypothetical protein
MRQVRHRQGPAGAIRASDHCSASPDAPGRTTMNGGMACSSASAAGPARRNRAPVMKNAPPPWTAVPACETGA